MLPGIGWPELVLIMALLLLVFGSGKVHHIAKSVGRGLGEIRRVKEEIEEGVGIGQLRRVKQEMVQGVMNATGSVTKAVIDLKDYRVVDAGPGDKPKV